MRHGLFDEQQLEVWLQAIIGNMDTKDVKICESSTLNWTNSMRIENDILKRVA